MSLYGESQFHSQLSQPLEFVDGQALVCVMTMITSSWKNIMKRCDHKISYHNSLGNGRCP